jgi:hypothetical protein
LHPCSHVLNVLTEIRPAVEYGISTLKRINFMRTWLVSRSQRVGNLIFAVDQDNLGFFPGCVCRCESKIYSHNEALFFRSAVCRLGNVREVAPGRRPSQAGTNDRGSGPHRPGRKRHRGGAEDAASQEQAIRQFCVRENAALKNRERAVEMTGDGKQGNPNNRFPFVSQRPWKWLRGSHIPTAPTTILSPSQFNLRKEPQPRPSPHTPAGSSFDEKMLERPFGAIPFPRGLLLAAGTGVKMRIGIHTTPSPPSIGGW